MKLIAGTDQILALQSGRVDCGAEPRSCLLPGAGFSFGVHSVELADDPENWRDFARNWLREHQVAADLAMLAAGPSTRNPDANSRLEFLRTGGHPDAARS